MEYGHSSHYVYSCKYHIIFCPKYRRSVLVDGVDIAMKDIITQYAEKKEIKILGMEVMPDHVHLLLDCPLNISPLDITKGIKQSSAVQLRKAFPQLKSKIPCMWSRSAFIATVGSISMEKVKSYILDQKKK